MYKVIYGYTLDDPRIRSAAILRCTLAFFLLAYVEIGNPIGIHEIAYESYPKSITIGIRMVRNWI